METTIDRRSDERAPGNGNAWLFVGESGGSYVRCSVARRLEQISDRTRVSMPRNHLAGPVVLEDVLRVDALLLRRPVLALGHRVRQGRPAPARLHVEVGPVVEEELYHFGAAIDRPEEGSVPVGIDVVRVGTGTQQGLGALEAASVRGDHE